MFFDSLNMSFIVQELNSLRAKCMKLYGYDWISLPLVYTQVLHQFVPWNLKNTVLETLMLVSRNGKLNNKEIFLLRW